MRKTRRSESRTRPRGAALVEYVLLLSLFTLAAVPAITNLKNDEKTALRSTSAKIGGSPVPTDIAPELRTTTTTTSTTTTTLRPNNPPVVHLPDGIVVPRDTFRSFSPDILNDPEGDPITGKLWYSVGGATWENQGRDETTSNAVLKWTSAGWRTLCFRATDSLGASGEDCCDVCVSTGSVTAVVSATAQYQNATNSNWRLNATFRVQSGGNNVRGPITLTYRFDFSDGTSSTGSCFTGTGSSCSANSGYKPTSITWMRATITGVDGSALPCFGSWNGTEAAITINLTGGTGSPPTITSTTTTTTTTLPTTSTSSTSSTTTRATTTTSTTTTTTTRPTTTTFQS